MKSSLLAINLAILLVRTSMGAPVVLNFDGLITDSSHTEVAVGSSIIGKFQIDRSKRPNSVAPKSVTLHSVQGEIKLESAVLPPIVFSPALTGLQITDAASDNAASIDAISIFGAVNGKVEPAGAHLFDYAFLSFHEPDGHSLVYPFRFNIVNAPPNVTIAVEEPPYLAVQLAGPGNLFNSNAIDWNSVSTAPFTSREGTLLDLSGSVRFRITSISLVPEPASSALFLLATVGFLCRRAHDQLSH